MDMGRQKISTICWDCVNACRSGCSWSENFTPVEGWEAEHIVDEKKGTDTYRVIRCPQFAKESRANRNRNLDEEGCIRMVEQLMKLTREDYIKDPKLQPEIERFLRGKGASRVHRIADPEKVIRKLKKAALAYKKRKAQQALVKG